jgi:hypothetical protein
MPYAETELLTNLTDIALSSFKTFIATPRIWRSSFNPCSAERQAGESSALREAKVQKSLNSEWKCRII